MPQTFCKKEYKHLLRHVIQVFFAQQLDHRNNSIFHQKGLLRKLCSDPHLRFQNALNALHVF